MARPAAFLLRQRGAHGFTGQRERSEEVQLLATRTAAARSAGSS